MATAEHHMENSVDLSKQFLLAMPGMVGGEWANTVIFLCEHNEQGALGLVVNRPTDLMLPDLLQRLSIEVPADSAAAQQPVFFGGPVHTDRGFVLHTPGRNYSASIPLGDVLLTTSRDVLEDIAAGQGPAHYLVTLGYSGWGTGQLESELAQNAWLNVSSSNTVIFDVPPEARYESALGVLGIHSSMLTGTAGHA
jgi:putative transcriptional regulator